MIYHDRFVKQRSPWVQTNIEITGIQQSKPADRIPKHKTATSRCVQEPSQFESRVLLLSYLVLIATCKYHTHPWSFLQVRDCITVLVWNHTGGCHQHWNAVSRLFAWRVTKMVKKSWVYVVACFSLVVSFHVNWETRYHGVRSDFFEILHSLFVLRKKSNIWSNPITQTLHDICSKI